MTIKIVGNKVYRPVSPWSRQVHKFLYFLQKSGFDKVPEPLGFNSEGQEIVRFVKGVTSDYPLPKDIRSNEVLISSAKFLRSYHDVSQKFLLSDLFSEEGWMFPCRKPQEVICHNDFAPYNICFKGKRVVGVIDFDTAHPAPRTWDIVYAIYRFAPFSPPKDLDSFGSINEQVIRARLFCEAYELAIQHRKNIADMMIERIHILLEFLLESARNGDIKYMANIQNGHHLKYLNDIKYIGHHKKYIQEGVLGAR